MKETVVSTAPRITPEILWCRAILVDQSNRACAMRMVPLVKIPTVDVGVRYVCVVYMQSLRFYFQLHILEELRRLKNIPLSTKIKSDLLLQ